MRDRRTRPRIGDEPVDTYAFLSDPRAIELAKRRAMRASMQRENDWWLDRLQRLGESPRPEADFPAYLLATPPFRDLARKLAAATRRAELDVAAADELDWFLRAFRDYLRTDAGEDVFSNAHPGSLAS
jgi:hypothetical protein